MDTTPDRTAEYATGPGDYRRSLKRAAAARSIERRQHLEDLLAAGSGAETVVAACLRPPLYATRFGEGFGTLYTAEYRPVQGVAAYHWPGRAWEHSVERLGPGTIEIRLGGDPDGRQL